MIKQKINSPCGIPTLCSCKIVRFTPQGCFHLPTGFADYIGQKTKRRINVTKQRATKENLVLALIKPSTSDLMLNSCSEAKSSCVLAEYSHRESSVGMRECGVVTADYI